MLMGIIGYLSLRAPQTLSLDSREGLEPQGRTVITIVCFHIGLNYKLTDAWTSMRLLLLLLLLLLLVVVVVVVVVVLL